MRKACDLRRRAADGGRREQGNDGGEPEFERHRIGGFTGHGLVPRRGWIRAGAVFGVMQVLWQSFFGSAADNHRCALSGRLL